MTLFEAIEANNIEALEHALQAGANVDGKDEAGQTPVALAASRGHVVLVRLLIAKGADLFGRTFTAPLIAASDAGHLEIVQILLKAGAFIYETDKQGRQALHAAAGGGHLEVVKLLVEHGAGTSSMDAQNEPPLVKAALRGYVQVVEYLRSFADEWDLERIDAVHQWKSDRRVLPNSILLFDAALAGNLGRIREMVALAGSPNAVGENGLTLLMQAANRGHMELVQFLLGAGAEIDRQDGYRESALSYAAMGESLPVFELLWPLSPKKHQKRVMQIVLRNQHINAEWRNWKPPDSK